MVIKTEIIGNIKTIIGKWYYNKDELLSKLANKADNTTATLTDNGLMSSSDKAKLDGISAEANKTVVDSTLSDTSENPVQNKVVKNIIENHDHDARYYTETEIDSKLALLQSAIDAFLGFRVEMADTKPANGEGIENTIYLVPKDSGDGDDIYNEYIYKNGRAELFANTNIDLTEYVTLAQLNAALESKADDVIVTQSSNGIMTKEDKAKLDGISNGATNVTVDSSLSNISENPVQNKVISQTIGNINAALNKILE